MYCASIIVATIVDVSREMNPLFDIETMLCVFISSDTLLFLYADVTRKVILTSKGRKMPTAATDSPEQRSGPSSTLCAICNLRDPLYTCPRCLAHTCSASCSAAHKTIKACSGERNKAKYVKMNEYGWGTMMNDYVFLEDIGRKVEEWGQEIGRGRFTMPPGHGRGREQRNHHKGNKRDTLKTQLELMDIEMDLLPTGMERSKLNQSTWNAKCVRESLGFLQGILCYVQVKDRLLDH